MTDLENSLVQHKHKIQALEDAVRNREIRNDDLASENSKFKIEVTNLNERIERLNQDLMDLEAEKMRLQKINNELLNDLNRLKTQVQQFDQDLKKTQYTLDQKHNENLEFIKQVHVLEDQNHSLSLKSNKN